MKLDNKGSEYEYYENYLSADECDELIKELLAVVPWTHGVYNMFGKPIKTPRLLYAMCDKDFDITSSYTVTKALEWSPFVLKLKNKIENLTGKKFLYAQLNYYRNGDDYIGFHCDKEVQSGDIIASVSLGCDRKFIFRCINYKTSKKKHEMVLKNGSLLVMNEQTAKTYWKHSLPKSKTTLPRFNITFRPR